MCEKSRSIVFLNDISYTGQDFFKINSYTKDVLILDTELFF